jgi:UDP-N-acetylmuramyl pentapeptide phosphotransferase/UDP-N-acetylglucosamine-1-phosphate transferase
MGVEGFEPGVLMRVVIVLTIAFTASWAATAWLVGYLRRAAILDLPSDRSSHTIPTPRGGGLAVIAVALPLWVGLGILFGAPTVWLVAPAGAAVLAAVSWMDDRRGLAPLPRLLVQAAAVLAGLATLGGSEVYVLSDGLPWWLDRLVAGLGWLWFVNLYNFMDGIDGLAGVETIHVALGAAIIGFTVSGLPWLGYVGVVLAGAAAGFLMLNWHPAKLFMGDVGSVPVGYLLGYMLVTLAAEGYLAAALILPAYYLADATITLVRRAVRGAKVWEAHREHFYQRAARTVGSHSAVVTTVVAVNFALLGLALLSVRKPWLGLAAATAVVAGLLWRLAAMARSTVGGVQS